MKFILCLFFISSFTFANDLIFKKNDKVIKTFKMAELRKGKIEELKSIENELYNPAREHTKVYVGYDFFKLLDKIYGPEWRTSKRLSFYALDGYKQVIATKKMIKAAKKKVGILAYKEKDKEGFSLFERKGKEVDPGPLYLVWTGYSIKSKFSHGDPLKAPYQLQTIDIQIK